MRPNASLSRWRRLTPLIAVPILALIALICWGLSSPVGSSPDDDFHLASIWCGSGDRAGECAPGSEADERTVSKQLVVNSVCYAYHPNRSADCQGVDYGSSAGPTVSTDRGNFASLYPPVFYFVMSAFAGPNIAISVVVMRIVNALLFVGLATALFFLVPLRRRSTVVWSLVITMIPLGLFLIPSTNPSSWAVMSAGLLFISLRSYFETTGARRILLGVFAVLATVMGAGARADSAVYAGVAVVATLILTARKTRSFLLAAILPVALVAIAIVFWAGSGQSLTASAGLDTGSSGPADTSMLIISNLQNVPELWVGTFGKWGLGWLDTAMPAIVWVGAFGVFCVVLFAAARGSSRRKILAAAVVFASVWLIPTILLVQTRALVGSYIQPRYIYPLIILLAGVMLVRTARSSITLTRWQAVFLLAVLAVAQSLALHAEIRRYVTGVDVGGFNLDSQVEWWWNLPVSPMGVWFVGSVAFAGMLLLLVPGILRPRATPPFVEERALAV